MGVHEYTCFIGRNDQNTILGSETAIIALVPNTHSIEEILSWKLTEFKKYPIITEDYSWDDWDFTNLNGYSEFLEKEHWWERAIWNHSDYPNILLINFEPAAYKTFVLGQNEVDEEYYSELFEYRGLDKPDCDDKAYNFIVDCGEENIAEFHGDNLPPLDEPESYDKLYWKVMGSELFTKTYKYKLNNTPDNLTKDRLCYLTKTKVTANNEQLSVEAKTTKMWTNNSHCVEHRPGDVSVFLFKFSPKIMPLIDSNLQSGCFYCDKRPLRSKYTCVDHLDEEVDINKQQNIVNTHANFLIDRLKVLSVQKVPKILHADISDGTRLILELA